MGCSSCSSNNNGLPAGCKNNGACGTYGCNKLEVFDWLAGMELPLGQKAFDVVEVRFKNSRKHFYRNVNNLELYPGDVVAVEASPGHDIGVVSLTGELVRIQLKRKDVKDNFEVRKIYRKAKEEDIAKWQEGRQLEQETMMRARTIARELDLQMKISDVEYQGDKSKVTFFYTADDRVDFRELIKRYAEAFKVRIEMRQIGYRVEAGRLGGIGSCGRELCCSSWLTDFRAVSTGAARYQQLSLNPAKLAGQCGKLKCCLNYELDQYVEAFKDLPSTNIKLKLPKGMAMHFKTDIFKRTMYYIYDGQPGESPFPLSIDAVKEIIDMNRKGIAIEDVDDFIEDVEATIEESTDFAQVVGQDSLTRFDQKRRNKRGGRGRTDNRNQNRNENQNENRNQNQNRNENRNQNQNRNQNENRNENQKPETRNQKPETGNQKPETRNQKPRPARQQGEQHQKKEGGAPAVGNTPNDGKKPAEGDRPRNNNNRRRNNNQRRGPKKDGPTPPPQS
ncbi:MAG: PSP1 domain-containing protein [Flavobacteriales bacterium]